MAENTEIWSLHQLLQDIIKANKRNASISIKCKKRTLD